MARPGGPIVEKIVAASFSWSKRGRDLGGLQPGRLYGWPMARLSSLSRSTLVDLLALYGLRLRDFEALEAGSVNSNFFLFCEEGEFFARIYEEQGMEGAGFELALNLALARANVPVARPRAAFDGSLVQRVPGRSGADQPFAIYERIEGEVLCQAQVTPEHTRAVGRSLAWVHVAPLEVSAPSSRFGVDGLLNRLDRVENSGRTQLVEDAKKVRTRLVECIAVRNGELPQGLIHGDLFRDNVLVAGAEIRALLDFESASLGPYVYDLAVTLLAWCYGANFIPELCASLLRGYAEVRPLTEVELDNFELEASVACLRFATTRMTDFSLRVPEGERPGRDYRRFLARLREIEQGALKPHLEDIGFRRA